MAQDEMRQVNALNKKLVHENSHLLLFYYGTKDRWCPMSYYYEMRELTSNDRRDENNNDSFEDNGSEMEAFVAEQQAKPDVILDSHGMEHSFILFKKQSSIMSRLIHEWVGQLKF